MSFLALLPKFWSSTSQLSHSLPTHTLVHSPPYSLESFHKIRRHPQMLSNSEPPRNSLNLSLIVSKFSLSLYHLLPQIHPKKTQKISTKNHKIDPKTVLQNHRKPQNNPSKTQQKALIENPSQAHCQIPKAQQSYRDYKQP